MRERDSLKYLTEVSRLNNIFSDECRAASRELNRKAKMRFCKIQTKLSYALFTIVYANISSSAIKIE